jgi:hypothetical protein
VSKTGLCPYCGSVTGSATEPGTASESSCTEEADHGAGGLEPLYREVRRIREIAEARASDEDARRIAELTRQVSELRATVARLRGPGEPRLARAADAAAGRRAG